MQRTLATLIIVTAVHSADAQQIAVQQPIVGTTGVATSVMVPDQGRILLAGVNSAQSSRSRYGIGPSGSSLGLSRSSRSLSVGVTIIDLREMDEALLNSMTDPSPTDQSPSPWARQAAAISATSRPHKTTQTMSKSEPSPTERAARFEQLARNAEAKKQLGVAKLHWQMAAKYGSTIARERLAVAKAD